MAILQLYKGAYWMRCVYVELHEVNNIGQIGNKQQYK